MKEIAVSTADNYSLVASEFSPDTSNNKVILISAASGVRQEFYYNFAEFLAQHGFYVYTYDYRGIGKSVSSPVKDVHATYQIWATLDYPAMIQLIKNVHPEKKYYLIGHSFGGNGIGMSTHTNAFEKIVTIAASLTYWRYAPPNKYPIILFHAYILAPLVSRLFGYFPAKKKGLGENLPYGVAQQWRKGLTDPNSIVAIANPENNQYACINKKILMISIEDDWISSPTGVDALAKHFTNAIIERRHIQLTETTEPKIGHVNFFRQRFAKDLWLIPLQWINN